MDTTHFKRLLESRQAELLAIGDSGEQAAAVVELDQARVGRLSRMDAMQQQAMAQAARGRRDAELRAITQALARIESGEYGWCLACDEEIAAGRLQVDPAATLCIQCAERAGR
ncbi:MAG: TraR/DksA family transcriptional regulator [Xanthomonadales bacterium]|nr:TraR/DksA family transcriptional regulator [Xanthomonadales bacterium]